MKVLLIEPPKWVWDLMGDCVAPPLGLAQLAAVLEEERIPVELADCNALELGWRGTAETIRRAEPTLVGTTVLTPYFPQAIRTARIAKEVDPDIVTVLGGPHVTFTARETLVGHPEVDLIVRGEGEGPLVALARALESGADWATVPGIAYRRNGEIIETPSPAPVDPKTLPIPAYHLLPMERYHFEFIGNPFGVVQASRGCPHRCTFCSEWPFWGGGWRARDPESIVEELELLVRRYGCTGIWFADDCFNVSGDHMQAICEGILKRDLHFNWFYQGRADYLVRYGELLPLMRRTGNRMVQIGIEASTDEELRELNKQLEVEQVRQAVRLLRANDIVCQGLLIVGTPTDSGRSIQHKVRFAKQLDIDFPVFTIYTPFPGTGVYEQARAEGLLPDPPNYAHFDMAHALLPTEHLSVKELHSWYWWAVNSYYLDPLKILRGLFSRCDWKRQIWRLMTAYSLKKMLGPISDVVCSNQPPRHEDTKEKSKGIRPNALSRAVDQAGHLASSFVIFVSLCLRGEYLTSNRKETDVSEDFEIEEERDEKERGEGFDEKWQRDPIGAATGGLVLILLGLVLFAATQGWVQWGDFWAYFLVGLGLIFLVETAIRFAMPEYRRRVGGRLVAALILIAVGLGGIFGFTQLWPLILIAIGLAILIRGLLRRG